MKILMISSSLVSFFYINSSHPVILMALILTQTMGVCVVAWVKLKISWFSYILFLIFLGGLMVLFVYITSLASNELITTELKTYSSILILTAFMGLMMVSNMNFQIQMNNSTDILKTFNFMFSWNSLTLIILTMIYLLLTLIIVVKVSNKFEAPIKNLIFY